MANSKLIEKMSSKTRSYHILSELDKNDKITVLSEEDSHKIESNLEKEFIKIKAASLVQERMSKLSIKSSILNGKIL
jgi:hypothetical protein